MDIQHGRATTRLKYRFENLGQARAHVHDVDGRPLFFYRDEKLRLLPQAPVCLEFSFGDGAGARLLHGAAMHTLEGAGTWVALQDTRPLQARTEYTRTSRRIGSDLLAEVRAAGRIVAGRLLDLSEGGVRLCGVSSLAAGEAVELRLLSWDRLTFHDLSFGHVAWAHGEEVGVKFDPKDFVGRSAVSRLLLQTATQWRRVWEGVHPRSCCGESGPNDPAPPRLEPGEDAPDRIASR